MKLLYLYISNHHRFSSPLPPILGHKLCCLFFRFLTPQILPWITGYFAKNTLRTSALGVEFSNRIQNLVFTGSSKIEPSSYRLIYKTHCFSHCIWDQIHHRMIAPYYDDQNSLELISYIYLFYKNFIR